MSSRPALGPTAVAAALLLLAGCASTPASAPTSTTPAPTPTPTPTPTFVPVLVPTPPFGGDCGQVLTSAQLDGLLGDGWVTLDEFSRAYASAGSVDVPDLPSVASLGGIACEWLEADRGQDLLDSIGVAILPAKEAPADVEARFSSPTCLGTYDGSSCAMSTRSGDAWILATVPFRGDRSDDVLANILAEVSATIGSDFESIPVDRGTETTLLPDCQELGEAIHMEELVGEGYKVGPYEITASPETILLEEAGAEVTCTYTGPDRIEGRFDMVDAAFSVGADWAWDEIAAADGAESVDLPGGGAAVLFSAEHPQVSYVFATDGANLYRASGIEVELLLETMARLLPAMGD